MNGVHQRTFDEVRRARSDDPATSKTAARAARALASEHRRLILEALRVNGRALSAHEIAACCGLSSVQVSRRLGELRDDGEIVVTEDVRATPSGRPAHCWRIA